jgi:hypothetical protein
MDNWWEFGEHSGFDGTDLGLFRITCAFCGARGNFALVQHEQKKHPSRQKVLNYDTMRCGNCANCIMVFWSAGDRLHDYHVVPWPLRHDRYPEHWPADVGRLWLQAKRSLLGESWDAAALMARSALQAALRLKQAEGKSLKQEIDDLAVRGELPPIMKQWSDELRELGNDSAHPAPGAAGTAARDARDVVRFLDFLLDYLFTLPHDIESYRSRKNR